MLLQFLCQIFKDEKKHKVIRAQNYANGSTYWRKYLVNSHINWWLREKTVWLIDFPPDMVTELIDCPSSHPLLEICTIFLVFNCEYNDLNNKWLDEQFLHLYQLCSMQPKLNITRLYIVVRKILKSH